MLTISMLYTVYRTTNLINGKFYIGIHRTDDPLDAYLGSGTILRRSIAKYGEKNFRKEILFVSESASEAFDWERCEVGTKRRSADAMSVEPQTEIACVEIEQIKSHNLSGISPCPLVVDRLERRTKFYSGVVQSGRTRAFDTRCYWFKSSRRHHS